MWVGSASRPDHLRRRWRSRPARCGGVVSGPRTGPGSVAGCARSWRPEPRASRWRWRWRAAPGGAMWSRRSPPPASRPIWPSRPTPRRPGAASSTPRPTAATPGCCASCWPTEICPRSWIPPEVVLEWRERVRLYKSLLDQRTQWIQRIHAELFQHGVALPEGADPLAADPGAGSTDPALQISPAARQRIATGYAMIEATDAEAQPLKDRPDPLRDTPAGLPGPGRRPLRDRRADRGGGVVRAGRLSTLLPLDAGGAPHRPGRHRRLLRPPPGRRPPVPPGTRDPALGAVRGGQELLAQPPPPTTTTTRR